jgi:hypothetical protein
MGALHLSNEFSWSDNATHSLIQFQVGAGWAVKSQLEWNHPLVIRHGPEAVIGVALFQRLYLDVVYDYFLDDCMGNNRCANISAQVSPTAPPLVENDWALWLTLGYRFALN